MEIVYEGKSNEYEGRSLIRKYFRQLYLDVHSHIVVQLLVFGPTIFVILFWFFPVLRPIAVTYLLWIYYDRNTPFYGGRKLAFMRKLSVWKSMREYFRTKLVKTSELPADKNYLFASFPHGIFSYGMGCNILNDGSDFDKAYPGLNPYCVSVTSLFYVPITRDVLLLGGVLPATKQNIIHLLSGPPGKVCIIVVGGLEEMHISTPGCYKLVLRRRKGFIRTAIQTGAPLVPVFSFGETNTFRQPTGKIYHYLQNIFKSIFRMPLFVLVGRGYFLLKYICCLPYRTPITTIIGKPMVVPKIQDPSEDLVNEYHAKFISELEALFQRFKGKYDEKGELATLEII